MIFEIRKMLRRREFRIVFILSLIAAVLLTFRAEGISLKKMAFTRKKTAVYAGMSLDETIAGLKRELGITDQNSFNSGTQASDENEVLYQMLRAAEDEQKHEQKIRELVLQMHTELGESTSDFERRDLEKAIRRYNRSYRYIVCSGASLTMAFLNLDYGSYFEILFLLVLCALLSPLFTAEHETGMYQILYASKKGKRGLFRKKICSGMICAAGFSLIYTSVVFVLLWLKYGLSFRMFAAPVQCIEQYRNCPYALSIAGFLLISALMRAIVGALMVSVIAFVSCFCRKSMTVFGASCAIAAIPVLLSKHFTHDQSGQLFMKRLGLMRLPYLREYFTQYETVNVFGYPVDQILLSVGCTCMITACLFFAAYWFYTTQLHFGKQVKSCCPSKN